jgi:5-(carboxyamino)imidazole ribonucleotide synthase
MNIGVLGGGQLGQMLGLAGIPLGFSFRFFDPNPESPAKKVGELVVGEFHDRNVLNKFLQGLDIVTYEFENVPVQAVEFLSEYIKVHPNHEALRFAQDRWIEKQLFYECEIPHAKTKNVSDIVSLDNAVTEIGTPCVLKTRRLGYDGKGQFVINDKSVIDAAWNSVNGVECVLEEMIPFNRELSAIAVRSMEGEIRMYPLIENTHDKGILRCSTVPAPNVSKEMYLQAYSYCERIMNKLDYVGVLALEMFDYDGTLLANEFAPRVHNSGHWSIEGAYCSQFENHLRAIAGFPLGNTTSKENCAMINIIGRIPQLEPIYKMENAHLHIYGKQEREMRKLGHITICDDNSERLSMKVMEVLAIVNG